jgi:hypothetical protein
MPVQLRTAYIQPNQTATFDFTGYEVLSFVTGIAYWEFSFVPDEEHHVETIALSLVNNQPDSRTVTAEVNCTFSDDSGNNIDNEASKVVVCCVAVVDSADSNLALAGASSIPDQGASPPIALPGSSLAISSAFLSGFNLSYGSTDHEVNSFETSAGFAQNGSQGAITAQAQMSDSSGNNAATATINGGLIAATPGESGLLAQSRTNLQVNPADGHVELEFGTEISAAVALLQDMHVQFDDDQDHTLTRIGGGCFSWEARATSVVLNTSNTFMSDNSGNSQDNSASSISVLVVAIP